jgi:hypothetical protein
MELGETIGRHKRRLAPAATPHHSTPGGWNPPSVGTWTAPMAGRAGHLGTAKRRRGRSAAPRGEQWRWPPDPEWTPVRGWGRAERRARSREREPSIAMVVTYRLLSSKFE